MLFDPIHVDTLNNWAEIALSCFLKQLQNKTDTQKKVCLEALMSSRLRLNERNIYQTNVLCCPALYWAIYLTYPMWYPFNNYYNILFTSTSLPWKRFGRPLTVSSLILFSSVHPHVSSFVFRPCLFVSASPGPDCPCCIESVCLPLRLWPSSHGFIGLCLV